MSSVKRPDKSHRVLGSDGNRYGNEALKIEERLLNTSLFHEFCAGNESYKFIKGDGVH